MCAALRRAARAPCLSYLALLPRGAAKAQAKAERALRAARAAAQAQAARLRRALLALAVGELLEREEGGSARAGGTASARARAQARARARAALRVREPGRRALSGLRAGRGRAAEHHVDVRERRERARRAERRALRAVGAREVCGQAANPENGRAFRHRAVRRAHACAREGAR